MVINADQLRIIISIKEKHILIAIYLEDNGLGTIMKNKSYDSLIRQASIHSDFQLYIFFIPIRTGGNDRLTAEDGDGNCSFIIYGIQN
jgi:hypothetical protein